MKKILAISFLAISAVTAANADIASKAYVDSKDTAMNTRIEAAEGSITTLNGDSSTAGSVANSIATAVGALNVSKLSTANNFVKTITETDGKVSAEFGQVTDDYVASNAAISTAKLQVPSNWTQDANATGKVAASDSVSAAFSKLQNQIDSANTSVGNLDLAQVGSSTNPEAVIVAVSQADGQVAATAAQVTNAMVADSAAIASSKLASGLVAQGSNISVSRNETSGVYTVGVTTATSVTGTGEDASKPVTSGAVYDLIDGKDATVNATANKVVTGVTMADGVITSVASGDPLTTAAYSLQHAGYGAGKYVLTAVLDNQGKISSYTWELIERGTNGETADASAVAFPGPVTVAQEQTGGGES